MRKIIQSSQNNHEEWKPPTLRIATKAAVYARRSDPTARKKETDDSQSREMQTGDLLSWAIHAGWEERLFEPYFADLGLSGTLRPDERPDMLRLFDDIDRGIYDHGTVVCYQESRLFRDETQIYYNQFIQKCKAHDVLVVVVSPYVMIYDFQDEFLTEMFRWKCKEAGDFIKRHVKGWMLPARERAARQGQWAGLGDISIVYVVDIEPTSPTFKRFVMYEPHAKIVKWIFIRYMELCGNISVLIKELTSHPICFPPLTLEEEQKYYLKNGIMNRSGGILRTCTALESILTNRMYLGWRVVNGVVTRKDSHTALVDEDVFSFAFTRLTGHDVEGNQLNAEPKEKRYYRTMPERAALLKDVVTSETGRVYVKMLLDKKTRKYTYVPDTNKHGFWRMGHIEMIDIDKLDEIVVDRLFFHIQKINDLAGYQEIIEQRRAERKAALKQVIESINSIPTEQKRLREQMRKTERESVRDMLLGDIEDMEQEKEKLEAVKERLERENENDIGNLDKELQLLITNWQKYPFERRVALLNFLIQEVSLDMASPRWLRIRVRWSRNDWGHEQMYLLREEEKAPRWTEEELEYLRDNLLTVSKDELMEHLDIRTWQAIRHRGYVLGITRHKYDHHSKYMGDASFCVRDYRFMAERGIEENSTITKWKCLSTHASSLVDCGVFSPHRLSILRKILHGFSPKERGM